MAIAAIIAPKNPLVRIPETRLPASSNTMAVPIICKKVPAWSPQNDPDHDWVTYFNPYPKIAATKAPTKAAPKLVISIPSPSLPTIQRMIAFNKVAIKIQRTTPIITLEVSII